MKNLIGNQQRLKQIAVLFLGVFISVYALVFNSKTNAQSTSSASIPSSGSCALLLTLPVPYGFNVANNTRGSGEQGAYQTGYNLIGQINFTSSTAGTFSGRIINPTFNIANSPYIDSNGGVVDLNGFTVSITPMTSNSGFSGGYTLVFTGTMGGSPLIFDLVGVPSNSGKTIVLVSSHPGTRNDPGIGPGQGVCQV